MSLAIDAIMRGLDLGLNRFKFFPATAACLAAAANSGLLQRQPHTDIDGGGSQC